MYYLGEKLAGVSLVCPLAVPGRLDDRLVHVRDVAHKGHREVRHIL